jgi:4-aminobutyrate aminotransferase-like enzyme
MKDEILKKSFLNKISNPRKDIGNQDDVLTERINKKKLGPKVKEALLKDIKYESTGQPGFALFDTPPLIDKGNNDIVYDVDGKEYLDFLSSFAVTTIGSQNPKVIEAIKKQTDKLINHFDFPTIPRIELAEKLCSTMPGTFEKKVRFSVTGSDAIENAIHAARWFTGSQFLLSAYGAYHGVTPGTMGLTSKGGIASHYYPMMNNNGIAHFPYAYCYRCPHGREYPACDMFCTKFIEKNMLTGKECHFFDEKRNISNIAAMVIEPMQCSSGYIIPPDDFLRELKVLSDKYGFLMIVDEIQAGIGRSGKLWAVEHSGIEPDILAIGKGIGGGLPFSAIITKKSILNSWKPGAHVSTFAGYALGCAVALRVLEIIEEDNLLENSNKMGDYFYDKLQGLQEKHGLIGNIDGGKGLFLAMELVKDRKTKEPASDEAKFLTEYCFENGLLFEYGGYLYNRIQFVPPITVRKDSIDEAIKIMDRGLTEAKKRYNN